MCSFEFSDRRVSCPHFNHIKTTCEHPENKTGECEEMDCPTLPQIRVLAVRQPWASLIIAGLKTIEVRSRNTNIRGPVAIYAGQHVPTKAEIGWVNTWIINHYENSREIAEYVAKSSQLGQVLGTVNIWDSKECETWEDFKDTRKFHWNLPTYYSQFQKTTKVFWYLERPTKFSESVNLPKWPSGGPWAKIPKSILPEINPMCNKRHFDKEEESAVSEKRMYS